MAMSDEIRQENQKMKDMTFKGKCGYIWDYYKVPIIAGIIIIILGTIFVRDFIEGRKPEYISAEMVNTVFYYDETPTILEDFINYAQIDTKEYNIGIETTGQIDPEGYDQGTIAMREKLMAYYSSHSMNVLIAPEEVVKLYDELGAHEDITGIFTQDEIDSYVERGYDIYYANEEGKIYPAGFYIGNSEYLKNQCSRGAYLEEQKPVFTFPVGLEEHEHAKEFLEFITQ